jgi:hypothetical protein
MKFTVILHARSGQQFSRQSFDNLVDDYIVVKSDFGKSYSGLLMAADVQANGQAVHLTMELNDES